ncbi:MAG: sulfur carrier protein ThiS [Rhizobiaceae bacterium]|jgi:sulfur carrier protein|nr:sulfur carrier protein ThiS [Rhizobiaceae bacterium]
MNIQLNGEMKQTDAATLEALLDEHGFGGAKIATALNGEFVPAPLRASTKLKDGDRLEVLAPMQGG